MKWFGKVVLGCAVCGALVLGLPMLIGIWLPDVISAPREKVLAEERNGTGEVARVVQTWNRIDFYTTEFVLVGKDGREERFCLDPDDSKSWRVPVEIYWEMKRAKVTLGGGRVRHINWSAKTVERW